MTKKPAYLLAIAALALTAGSVIPVHAGPAEVALLSNYIGDWRGAGVLQGGDTPEPFTCRLTMGKGNQARINYAGRCTLVNMNLSVSGTIAYDDPSHTYQAIMSSNAGFKGVAVGRVQGDKISFDLAQKSADRAGNAVRLGARIALSGSSSITIDYQVEFNDSGKLLTATVPFAR